MALRAPDISSPASRGLLPDRPARIGRVEVFASFEAAQPAWQALEALCPATVYQTRRFLGPWLATLGAALTPMIVVASDLDGAPAALLPFGISRRGPLRIASFLGGSMSNSNPALFRPDLEVTPQDVSRLLLEAARAATTAPDVFALHNQPRWTAGRPNPFLCLSHQPSPSATYAVTLNADPAVLMKAHLSGPAARKLRNKRRRLAEAGELAYVMAGTTDELRGCLDAFLEQKVARLRARGIASEFEGAEARAFLEQLVAQSAADDDRALELHALKLGDRFLAIYGGARHGDTFYAMFNSFDEDPEISRSSPGDLLLQDLLTAKCREGLTSLDLGIGEARYKAAWCDVTTDLFDAHLPLSVQGHAYALCASAYGHAKRWVKGNPKAWALAQRLRRI